MAVRRPAHRFIRASLDFPLFYKILIANAALVAIGVAFGSWLGAQHLATSKDHATHWEFILWFGGTIVLVIVGMNYALLKAALQPVSTLTRLISAVGKGKPHIRVRRPLFGDQGTVRALETTTALVSDLAAYRDRLHRLSERATRQLETERENIARELHDGTAQYLAALLVLEKRIAQATDDDESAGLLDEARNLTRLVLGDVRRMSLGLRPAVLDDAGLPAAIRWYTAELLGNVLPPRNLYLDESIGRCCPVTELALYRIVQEALSNVVRHASARQVHVSLHQDREEVVLRVKDDGIGFDLETPNSNSRDHLGLFTITERARLAGGRAVIRSVPGKGTEVIARCPKEQTPHPVGAGHER